jgi:hypothetical protein
MGQYSTAWDDTIQYSTVKYITSQYDTGRRTKQDLLFLRKKNVDRSKERKIESPQYSRKTEQKTWNENSIERKSKILRREQRNKSDK